MNTITKTPDNKSIAQLALETALNQLGQAEQPKGSNSGPMVDEYLREVGLNPGFAWCQAFVYWCYHQAAKQLLKTNPVVKTASVHSCWNNTTADKKISKTTALSQPSLLQPGYQFILSFGTNAGHTGIIESLEGNTIHTIEGNSNTDGSCEGYEVVRHKRNLNDKALLGFIKY